MSHFYIYCSESERMPCKICGKCVENGQGLRVRYCKCGACNHCHLGYVIGAHGPWEPHWYKNKTELGNVLRWKPCQSHGGSGIPDA